MANLFSNLGRAISDSFSEASTQTIVDTQRQGELSKLEANLKEIDLKLERYYTLLGQSVADSLRQNEPTNVDSLHKTFKPIQVLDVEREQVLDAIKEVKAQQADQLKAQELLRTKKAVEAEIQKIKELKDLGVMDEEEFEVSQAKLKKRVDNFEKIYALRIAFERSLISQEEYTKRKGDLE